MSDAENRAARARAGAELDERVRVLERDFAACSATSPGNMHRVEVVEASVDELRRLIAKQNDEWQSRFAKINRTISWAMGALAALVFFAQVVLPLARTSEPKVIQIVPQIAPAAPAPSK